MDLNPLFQHLPLANAVLNGTALVLLLRGRQLIHQGRRAEHKRAMVSAFVVSSAFLVLYLTHKAWQHGQLTRFHGTGLAQALYRTILISHSALAAIVPILAITLIVLGQRSRFSAHRQLARWAFPAWVYVSLTGVVIYLMLYPFNPAAPPG